MYRTLRVCSSRGGFEAIPDPPRDLDLRAIRARLEAAKVPVVDARVMLIANLETEVTISRSGRLLFKTSDAAAADRTFALLRPLIEANVPLPESAARGR